MKSFKIIAVVFFAMSLMAFSCKKNTDERAFYPPVDAYINVTLPQYTNLQVPGGWAYVTGGLKGIIVYRINTTDFIAYDRNCTFEEANSCGKADVESDNITISCPCDGSEYNIFDGSVNKNPATLPLKGYNTNFNSSNNTLRIFN